MTDTTTIPTLNGVRNQRIAFRLMVWNLAVTAFLAVVVILSIWVFTQEAYDPLGNYPEQAVFASEQVDGMPAVKAGEDVTVEGTKCNDAATSIVVRGTMSWVSVDPPGSVFDLGEGLGERPPGCETRVFANPMPEQVQQRITTFARRDVDASVWMMVGTDTPIANDGTEGVPRTWRTQHFVIVPSG